MTQYRTARAADSAGLYTLWRNAFGPVPHMIPLYEQDAGRYRRTFVAQQNRELLASVYYREQWIRDAHGVAGRVAGIGNVSSSPQARGRGLVRGLLAAAVDDMRQRGYSWSLLFTATPGVYQGSGFRSFALGYPAGELQVAPPPTMTVRDWPVDDWRPLAQLHRRFNAHRPLTTVRDDEHWARRVPFWYTAEDRVLLAGDDHPRGYAVVGFRADTLQLKEIAVTDAEAADALLQSIAARGTAAGSTRAELRVPSDPLLDPAVDRVLGRSRTTVIDDTGMALALDGVSEPLTTAGAAGAIHWPADYI